MLVKPARPTSAKSRNRIANSLVQGPVWIWRLVPGERWLAHQQMNGSAVLMEQRGGFQCRLPSAHHRNTLPHECRHIMVLRAVRQRFLRQSGKERGPVGDEG